MVEVQTDEPGQGRAKSSRRCSRCCRARAIIVDWQQMNSALFEALEVERIAMFIVLSLIVARRRVQHPVVADHAGPREDPRHRDPADHGREPARHDEDLRDGRA